MLTVTLSACPNPDFGQNARNFRVAPRLACVATLAEAAAACREYIDANGLGGGNWSGGEVWDDVAGKPVARVSYNGRIWTPEPWPKCSEIIPSAEA